VLFLQFDAVAAAYKTARRRIFFFDLGGTLNGKPVEIQLRQHLGTRPHALQWPHVTSRAVSERAARTLGVWSPSLCACDRVRAWVGAAPAP
jgi:hypothetical protein